MFVSAAFMGGVSAYLAYKKKKNLYLWFAIGFFFGLLGIFAIFFATARKKPAPIAPKPEPILIIQGPTDKFWFYLDPENRQNGPISRDALTTAWKEGKLDLSTYVWHEELPNWTPLKDTLKAEG